MVCVKLIVFLAWKNWIYQKKKKIEGKVYNQWDIWAIWATKPQDNVEPPQLRANDR